MSCEKLQEQVSQLKSELPQESDDYSLAHIIHYYLKKECKQLPGSHTGAMLRSISTPEWSTEEKEQAAKEILDHWVDSGKRLLLRYGITPDMPE